MKWLLAGRTRVLQTGNPKRRPLCVCVEEALGDRGTSLDTRNSVEAKHYQPRLMPRASLSRLLSRGRFQGSRYIVVGVVYASKTKLIVFITPQTVTKRRPVNNGHCRRHILLSHLSSVIWSMVTTTTVHMATRIRYTWQSTWLLASGRHGSPRGYSHLVGYKRVEGE